MVYVFLRSDFYYGFILKQHTPKRNNNRFVMSMLLYWNRKCLLCYSTM
jgi:hypothetical protein